MPIVVGFGGGERFREIGGATPWQDFSMPRRW
jgi:hypothetical protein